MLLIAISDWFITVMISNWCNHPVFYTNPTKKPSNSFTIDRNTIIDIPFDFACFITALPTVIGAV